MKALHEQVLHYLENVSMTEEVTTPQIAKALGMPVGQARRVCQALVKNGMACSKKLPGKGSGQFVFWVEKKPQGLWGWLVNLFK